MPRSLMNPERVFRKLFQPRTSLRCLVLLAILGLFFQTGCLFFWKHKKPKAAPQIPPPTRVVLLPLNIPPGNTDLQWASLATTVHMAEIVVAAPDLEPVPLWESMPAVLQTLGVSRSITPEIAEFTADRLAARWAVEGDMLMTRGMMTLRIEFIPAKASLVPFRYEKPSALDAMASHFQEGFDQFLHYLIVRPLVVDRIYSMQQNRLKEVARALDIEYGWFVPAKPAAAGKLVEELARANRGTARLLFNPALYPVLAK